MCKLIAMSSLSVRTLVQASKLINASSEMLGASQHDGFGYALKTDESVFIERYLDPKSCKGLGSLKASRDLLPATLRTQLEYGTDYDQQGIAPTKGSSLNGAFIAHGRTATCGKTITNTHPFTGFNGTEQWTIAHNGVVEWSGATLPLKTTCDSEHILNCFLYLQGEQSFHSGLAGYAAVVGINPKGEMFAMRDSRAPLYVSYVKELKDYIICTDSTHCTALSKMLIEFNGIKNATVTEPMMLAPYVAHTFHASGEITSVEFQKFDSSMSYASTRSVYRSLGSAGAAGYGSGSGKIGYGAWSDDDWGYGSSYAGHPSTPVKPVAPSTPSTPSVAGNSEIVVTNKDELDALRLQRLKQQRENSRKHHKPWKHHD